MPGKGAANRSKSTPRERPSSAGGYRPRTTGGDGFLRSTNIASTAGLGTPPSSRGGSPSGSRKVSTLNLSGTSGLSSSMSTYGGEKCICGICVCGRHRCPVQPKTAISYGGDSQFCTTHNDNFVNHDPRHYMPTRATREQVYIPGERFDHQTTQQSDYPWHERPASPYRSRSSMEKAAPSMLHHSHGPELRMDLTTSYGAQFVEHPIPSKSAKPVQATYSYGSPRELLTTKQLDYNGLQPPRCPASCLPNRPCSARSGHVKYNMDLSGTWN